MAALFQKATKKQLKARIAILGPAGSGKSYTALRLAFALADGGTVAAIDTEHRSLSKYVGENPDGQPWDFDVLELDSFSPDAYMEGIRAAEAAGYSVLVIDSLSHAWAGKGGILEYVDEVAKRKAMRSNSGKEDSWGAWREATPKHNQLVEAMLASRLHLIVTMRVKQEYVQEKDSQTGKTTIRKVGLQPIQRDGLEYEMDVVGDMDMDNNFCASKTRCSRLTGKVFAKPGPDVAEILLEWLSSGAPAPEPTAVEEETDWRKDADKQAEIRAKVAELGLSGAEVKEALGHVTRISDFAGGYEDLLARLDAAYRASITETHAGPAPEPVTNSEAA